MTQPCAPGDVLHRQYTRNPPLNDAAINAEVGADPLALFERWFARARAADLVEPAAVALGTVGSDGCPSVRVVLFRGLVDGGFSFYTDYESRKGRELATHPCAAMTFWWDTLERSVRIEGEVRRLAAQESDAYWNGRPRGSRLSASASRQSQPVAARAELVARVAELDARFGDDAVARPERWGGYVLMPARIEFWQGAADRLHDRFLFERAGDAWRRQRLQP
jgi:pyridoxamine-phosphate oxidase